MSAMIFCNLVKITQGNKLINPGCMVGEKITCQGYILNVFFFLPEFSNFDFENFIKKLSQKIEKHKIDVIIIKVNRSGKVFTIIMK